MHRTDHKAN